MFRIKSCDLFLFGLVLALLPYFYLCFFTVPVLDDFVFSYHFQERNFFELLKSTYLGWNGRYASNFFAHLNPMGFNSFLLYRFAAMLTLLFVCFGNYFLIKQLLFKTSTKDNLIISLIVSLLFFNNMPIISEGIYWYTGSSIYTLGVSFTFVYFGLLIKFIRKRSGFLSQFGLSVLLFLCCGFNEVLTLLIIFLIGVFLVLSFKRHDESKKLIIYQFLFTLIFASLLVFSPGNESRGNTYLTAHDFSHSLIYSVAQVARFSITWLFSASLFVASFLYFILNKKLVEQYRLFKNGFYINKWLSLGLLFVVIFICVFPPYWATGILGQHRTLNVAYAFFLPLWFVCLTIWFNFFESRLNRFSFNKTKVIFGLMLFIILLSTGNGYFAFASVLSGSANKYSNQSESRIKTLKTTPKNHNNVIYFEPLIENPKCLFVSDITNDYSNWKNQAYNLYFRVDSVKILIK
jgi:hypothetical protein